MLPAMSARAARPGHHFWPRLAGVALAAALLLGWAGWQLASGPAGAPTTAPGQGVPSGGRAPTAGDAVAFWQTQLRRSPADPAARAQLGLAYLQQVRETGDPAYYRLAQRALETALAADPAQTDAVLGQGMLALARHDFAGALTWGERGRRLNSYRADFLGILVDAQVELGDYEAAVATAQAMVDRRPDLAAFGRVAYLRELHGDRAGAAAALIQALAMGVPGSEPWLWTQVQLGHLYFGGGEWDRAEAAYRRALEARPDYPYALAGLGRVEAARGDLAAAVARYEALVDRWPLPEFVAFLAELYHAAGRPERVQESVALVRALQQLNAAAGVDVDLELAAFAADWEPDPAGALVRLEAVYDRRPTIYAADALAWALFRQGRLAEAARYSQEALRLGTEDAGLHYHAGRIAAARGQDGLARRHLRQALALNPAFSPRHAPLAAAILAGLETAP